MSTLLQEKMKKKQADEEKERRNRSYRRKKRNPQTQKPLGESHSKDTPDVEVLDDNTAKESCYKKLANTTDKKRHYGRNRRNPRKQKQYGRSGSKDEQDTHDISTHTNLAGAPPILSKIKFNQKNLKSSPISIRPIKEGCRSERNNHSCNKNKNKSSNTTILSNAQKNRAIMAKKVKRKKHGKKNSQIQQQREKSGASPENNGIAPKMEKTMSSITTASVPTEHTRHEAELSTRDADDGGSKTILTSSWHNSRCAISPADSSPLLEIYHEGLVVSASTPPSIASVRMDARATHGASRGVSMLFEVIYEEENISVLNRQRHPYSCRIGFSSSQEKGELGVDAGCGYGSSGTLSHVGTGFRNITGKTSTYSSEDTIAAAIHWDHM